MLGGVYERDSKGKLVRKAFTKGDQMENPADPATGQIPKGNGKRKVGGGNSNAAEAAPGKGDK